MGTGQLGGGEGRHMPIPVPTLYLHLPEEWRAPPWTAAQNREGDGNHTVETPRKEGGPMETCRGTGPCTHRQHKL